MGSPKEDTIGDINIGLSFIADQLMNRTESCCRYYLTCFLHFDTGKYRYTSPQYIYIYIYIETRKAMESMLVKHKSGITLYVA